MDDFVNEAGLLVASANKLIMQLLAQQGVSGLVPSHGALLNLLFTHEELDMS